MGTWIALLTIWCLFSWFYAAYQLLIPERDRGPFRADVSARHQLTQLCIWAALVLIAPVWVVLYELTMGDNTP